ncbi:hypothetical protein SAMN05444172_9077 [Burkholderia sp. GAS332]|nr:hypothetical protein SAMN05444172_9077 [Burkholderia sp. GAS332]
MLQGQQFMDATKPAATAMTVAVMLLVLTACSGGGDTSAKTSAVDDPVSGASASGKSASLTLADDDSGSCEAAAE